MGGVELMGVLIEPPPPMKGRLRVSQRRGVRGDEERGRASVGTCNFSIVGGSSK